MDTYLLDSILSSELKSACRVDNTVRDTVDTKLAIYSSSTAIFGLHFL